jgi:hypothetical protein
LEPPFLTVFTEGGFVDYQWVTLDGPRDFVHPTESTSWGVRLCWKPRIMGISGFCSGSSCSARLFLKLSLGCSFLW